MLKRRFGFGRVLAIGSAATAIWTGLAIFGYNLWKRTRLMLIPKLVSMQKFNFDPLLEREIIASVLQ